MLNWNSIVRWVADVLTPLVITLLLIYGSWVYSYYICWKQVHPHSPSKGIGLIVGNVLFVVLIYVLWVQMLVIGPGKQPALPRYRIIEGDDDCIEPPRVFSCDERGFPIWCSQCQSIKAERSHHSTRLNICIPRFDHYCSFLGVLIGKRNNKLFIQFCVVFWCYFIYVGVSMAVFTPAMKSDTGRVQPNVIVCFILIAMWLCILTALTAEHLVYLFTNGCTIDALEQRRIRREGAESDKFYSIAYKEGRRIVRVSKTDRKVWDQGLFKNVESVMGPNRWAWIWLFGTNIHNYGDPNARNYTQILGDYSEYVNYEHILALSEVSEQV